jgi:hypothetical protein
MEKSILIELSRRELMTIEAGKPIEYYLGYYIGGTIGTFESLIGGFIDGLKGEYHWQ